MRAGWMEIGLLLADKVREENARGRKRVRALVRGDTVESIPS